MSHTSKAAKLSRLPFISRSLVFPHLAERIAQVQDLIDESIERLRRFKPTLPLQNLQQPLFVFELKALVGLTGITNGNLPNRYLSPRMTILLVINILARQVVPLLMKL